LCFNGRASLIGKKNCGDTSERWNVARKEGVMVKRKIIETVKEYDEAGKLIKETVTETTEDDSTEYIPYFPTYPAYPVIPDTGRPWWTYGPTCTSTEMSTEKP
jgi:hypothetical protein